MTLYSADVLDMAKPVSKKGKGKQKEIEAAPLEPIEPTKPVKEKRPATEKQLAALAKAQETRKRKREEAEAQKQAAAKEEQDKIEKETLAKKALEEKKLAQKEKRKLKKLEKAGPITDAPTPPPTAASEQSMEEVIDREVKKFKKEDTPPAWFKQYVAGVKKEEAKISRDKKPNKQIRKEAQEVAHTQWADGFTRDRVQNEVDGHMSRMYQMMFSGRRMK